MIQKGQEPIDWFLVSSGSAKTAQKKTDDGHTKKNNNEHQIIQHEENEHKQENDEEQFDDIEIAHETLVDNADLAQERFGNQEL